MSVVNNSTINNDVWKNVHVYIFESLVLKQIYLQSITAAGYWRNEVHRSEKKCHILPKTIIWMHYIFHENHAKSYTEFEKKNNIVIIVKIDHEFAVFNRLVSIRQRLEILWWNEKQFWVFASLTQRTNSNTVCLMKLYMDGCLLWRPSTGIQDHPLTLHHEKLKLYYTNNKNRPTHTHTHTHMHLIIVLQDMWKVSNNDFLLQLVGGEIPLLADWTCVPTLLPSFSFPAMPSWSPAFMLSSPLYVEVWLAMALTRCSCWPHSSRRHPDCGRDEMRPCGGAASAHTPDEMWVGGCAEHVQQFRTSIHVCTLKTHVMYLIVFKH